eukprot:TRINITY_DN1252_c0_g1_i1.p2 TRINITY_DN1252_c0_g1~~TRINITY_DN1252_c0_g1_i1.p2  ORF type:complete len:288 (-),score=32.64 TRINITY_DN1252_c0_g1_i1:705-1568(-)
MAQETQQHDLKDDQGRIVSLIAYWGNLQRNTQQKNCTNQQLNQQQILTQFQENCVQHQHQNKTRQNGTQCQPIYGHKNKMHQKDIRQKLALKHQKESQQQQQQQQQKQQQQQQQWQIQQKYQRQQLYGNDSDGKWVDENCEFPEQYQHLQENKSKHGTICKVSKLVSMFENQSFDNKAKKIGVSRYDMKRANSLRESAQSVWSSVEKQCQILPLRRQNYSFGDAQSVSSVGSNPVCSRFDVGSQLESEGQSMLSEGCESYSVLLTRLADGGIEGLVLQSELLSEMSS